ncbi:MAG: response regulator [Deltaproteobacteria bacterium]|nr:response regulator [Deltaproteobacteria bacterium]
MEDDENIRDVCLEVLVEEGYEVEAAGNGRNALNKLKHSTFDLVITDINMPVMDGVSLYAHSLKYYPYLANRFLFMTGNLDVNPGHPSGLTEMDMTIIRKPFRVEDFLGQIKKLL